MNLIIVESPTKSKTLKGFLGKEYEVLATKGHIRDLPKSKLGIDIENNFEPQYVIPTKARKTVSQLKKEVEKAERVVLATDADREGEAIAWHLAQILNLGEIKNQSFDKLRIDPERSRMGQKSKIKNIERIVFHEITKQAIEEALKNPRSIDMNLVNAQQARRILDRLVGYKLSPFLWEKVMKRLSAGRVQSVALRLIVEREEEIKKFKSQEYWTIEALLKKVSPYVGANKAKQSPPDTFTALLHKINDEVISRLRIKTKEEAQRIVDELMDCQFKVLKVEKKEIQRIPPPPFITSTLQQEASKRLRFSAKQTMRLAQNLYESGLITYMRTDSLNIAKEFALATKNWIGGEFGFLYAAQAPRFFKTKSKLAQEAHEAIRPTNLNFSPEKIKENPQEQKLYELIRNRFLASQMPKAIFEFTTVEISAHSINGGNYILNASGNILRFDGFLKVWPIKYEEKELPELKENEPLELREAKKEQHFTEPPARYNEASLIKVLEECGIGRPSTYAPIISVIQERNYVEKNEQRRFQPTSIGGLVNKILVENFPEIVDIQFTAKMENELDEVARGKNSWQGILEGFYRPFSKNLEEKYLTVKEQKPVVEKTNEVCEKCGKPMVVKFGRFGKFLACSGFPECRNTRTYADLTRTNAENGQEVLINCPKCQIGKVVRRRTKKGRFFYGCSRYPDCDYATWEKPNKEKMN